MPSQTLDGKAAFYMVLLALQFGMQPLLTRRFTPVGICGSTVIVVQEVLKFFMALAMLRLSGGIQAALSGESLRVAVRRIDMTCEYEC